MKPITVLCTGIGSFSAGEGVVKALRAIPGKYRIVGCDMQSLSAMTYQVDAGYSVPAASSAEYFDRLNQILSAEHVAVLIPGSDAEMHIIANNTDKIKPGVFVLAHPQATVNICRDKWKTYEFLRNHGFHVPRAYLPENPEELPFPLIVKDRFGGGSKNIAVVQDEGSLQSTLQRMQEKGIKPIVQEYVGSEAEEYTTSILYGADGTLLSAITFRRTLYHGSTGTMECQEFPEINDYAARVAKALPSCGSLNIQSRLVNGKMYIFEINPRFSGSTAARVGLGVNEVDMAIDSYFLKQSVKPQWPKTDMVVLRFFEEVYVPREEVERVKRGEKTSKRGYLHGNN